MADVSIRIEMEFSGRNNGWTNVNEDVLMRVPIHGSRGIRGMSISDRVAMTGMLTFALSNVANTAGLEGYYTPGHANARAGFARGIGVRASIVIPRADPENDPADRVWQVDVSEPTFVDETVDFNSETADDVDPFPSSEATDDYFAVGFAQQFPKLVIDVGIVGVAGVVAWEYWNGSAWSALSGVTDDTNGFTASGENNVTFTVPGDWATVSLNGEAHLYYVRARVTTVYTTNPEITQGFIAGVVQTVHPQFIGTVTDIRPTSGKYGSHETHVAAVDYMDQLARKRLSSLAMLVDTEDDVVFDNIIAEMPVQPRALEIQDGFDTIDFAFDNMNDERAVPVAELQKLAQSTFSLVYLKSDGTLVYETRRQRGLINLTPVATITDADLPHGDPLSVNDRQENTINRAVAIIHPRRKDVSEVVLYRLQAPMRIEPNVDTNIRGLYTDPDQRAKRVGGVDMVTPVAQTDYKLNAKEDGTGTDLTAKVTMGVDFTANSALFTVNHDHDSAGFLTLLQARGLGIYDQERTALEYENSESIALIGEYAVSLDMPYQSDPAFALELAQWTIQLASQGFKQTNQILLALNQLSESRARLFASREISDRLRVEEPVTASAAEFYINAVEFRHDSNGLVLIAFLPIVADVTQFWNLEVVGASELGQNTRLGFGLVVGHTDVAHVDTHNDSEHSDITHSDSHTDDHEDSAHGDTEHTDTHGDSEHEDTAHTDAHDDENHEDVSHRDSHSDGAHVDAYSDVAHTDTHGDEAHFDKDISEYIDSPHEDTHGDLAYSDTHSDTSHSDTHSDRSHEDVSYEDSHWDISHIDIDHVDTHGDGEHTDQAHVDTHGDVTHADVVHSDADHGDTHGDSPHGDGQ